ncbi:hypothetical protein HDU92_002575 [Lobulomyces angularis]|nr:hypothetical protein HDU92_002575 [Lobulomyces angularis]
MNLVGKINETNYTSRIIGRFQRLKCIKHPSLCQYVEILKSRNERIYIISESFPTTLKSIYVANGGRLKNLDTLRRLAVEILEALLYLESLNISHRNICSDNILISEDGGVKLSNWGLNAMSGNGEDVPFPIGHPMYLPPESIFSYDALKYTFNPKADVWSLGILLLELYYGENFFGLNDSNDIQSIFGQLERWIFPDANSSGWKYNSLEELFDKQEFEIDFELRSFIKSCLTVDIGSRPSLEEIFSHDFIKQFVNSLAKKNQLYKRAPVLLSSFAKPVTASENTSDPFDILNLNEIFHLWLLSINGNIDAELIKQGSSTIPSMEKIPNLIQVELDLEATLDSALPHVNRLYSDKTYLISLDHLRRVCLESSNLEVSPKDNLRKSSSFSQLLLDTFDEVLNSPLAIKNYRAEDWKKNPEWKHENLNNDEEQNLKRLYDQRIQLKAKEKSVAYQYQRIKLFKKLLTEFPLSKNEIRAESLIDIPPIFRGKIWAALLNVCGNPQYFFDKIDTTIELTTDRQLDLDIPRCHQYNELLSSHVGRDVLKRILKAWVSTEKNNVYWQGLDSVCAPFVSLNFQDEAIAFFSFKSFASKFSIKFFVPDNSLIIQEYMTALQQLISFHDPGLKPELYAISWVMTLFSHVFPLDKIYHLWDAFLTGPPFPQLYAGYAILQHFRDSLTNQDFNSCMLLFSDVSAVDIEEITHVLFKTSRFTPPSALSHLEFFDQSVNSDIDNLNLPQSVPIAVRKEELSFRISLNDFKEMKANSLVFDIRDPANFELAHIPYSYQIKIENFQQIFSLLKNIGKNFIFVVVICDDDVKGGKLANLLVNAKLRRVCVLHASMAGMEYVEQHLCSCICPTMDGIVKCLNGEI